MVEAILAGRKTQTRRIISPKPDAWIGRTDSRIGLPYKITSKKPSKNASIWQEDDGKCYEPIKLRYGVPGDVLWVRETYYAYGRWEYRTTQKKGKDHDGWHFVDLTDDLDSGYRYLNDPPKVVMSGRGGNGWYKRPSLFMPRSASRILLEVVNNRIERLQDISEADAIAEGVEPIGGIFVGHYKNYLNNAYGFISPYNSYMTLWEYINGPESWSKNDYVTATSFRRI